MCVRVRNILEIEILQNYKILAGEGGVDNIVLSINIFEYILNKAHDRAGELYLILCKKGFTHLIFNIAEIGRLIDNDLYHIKDLKLLYQNNKIKSNTLSIAIPAADSLSRMFSLSLIMKILAKSPIFAGVKSLMTKAAPIEK